MYISPLLLYLCVFPTSTDPCQVTPQVEHLHNIIEIADSNQITDIDEIVRFWARLDDPNDNIFGFLFHFKGVTFDSKIGPQLKLHDRNKLIISVSPKVRHDKDRFYWKRPSNMIDFKIALNYVDKAQLCIQFYPDTEKAVTYRFK